MKMEQTDQQQSEGTLYLEDNVTTLYQINASEIFQDFKRNWRRFEPEFMNEFIETMELIAINNGPTVSAKDRNNWPYLENNKATLKSRNQITNPDAFPYADYFFSHERGVDQPSLYSFDEEYIVELGHAYFDLFFTLKLVFIDPSFITPFFDWQLDKSFRNSLEDFQFFLDNLSLKYHFIRDLNYTDRMKKYIKEKMSQGAHEKININSTKEVVTSLNAESAISTTLSVTQPDSKNADQETNKKANLQKKQREPAVIRPKEYYLNKMYLNITEVSEFTGKPVGTLYQLNHRGEIPSIKVGRDLSFKTDDILVWMEGHKKKSKRLSNEADQPLLPPRKNRK